MKEFELSKAFELLEPGPVILLSTFYKGRKNVMTVSWHMLLDFTPIIACSIGSYDYSYEALVENRECVISIPAIDLMEKTIRIGNCSGQDVDKFSVFELSTQEGKYVKPQLLSDCIANIECKVVDIDLGGYNCIVLKGLAAWINPEKVGSKTFHAKGDGTFVIDGDTIDLKHLMTKWM